MGLTDRESDLHVQTKNITEKSKNTSKSKNYNNEKEDDIKSKKLIQMKECKRI